MAWLFTWLVLLFLNALCTYVMFNYLCFRLTGKDFLYKPKFTKTAEEKLPALPAGRSMIEVKQ